MYLTQKMLQSSNPKSSGHDNELSTGMLPLNLFDPYVVPCHFKFQCHDDRSSFFHVVNPGGYGAHLFHHTYGSQIARNNNNIAC